MLSLTRQDTAEVQNFPPATSQKNGDDGAAIRRQVVLFLAGRSGFAPFQLLEGKAYDSLSRLKPKCESCEMRAMAAAKARKFTSESLECDLTEEMEMLHNSLAAIFLNMARLMGHNWSGRSPHSVY